MLQIEFVFMDTVLIAICGVEGKGRTKVFQAATESQQHAEIGWKFSISMELGRRSKLISSAHIYNKWTHRMDIVNVVSEFKALSWL